MPDQQHVILFDIDGTLMVSGNAGRVAIESILLSEFAIAEPAQVPIHGQTDRGIAGSLFREHGIEDNDQNWGQFYQSYLAMLPDALESCDGSLLPGAFEMLESLHHQPEVAVGLLTGNTREGAFHKLRYYGIDHFFQFGGFGDDHACRNDVAKAAMDDAQRHLEFRPEPDRTWVIGDTPNDVRCARAIDARVVAVATGKYSFAELSDEQPDLCLENLSTWQSLIDQITAE